MRVSRFHHAPHFTAAQWHRLMLACPIKYNGNMPNGDFLMCRNVSETQWRNARIIGWCYIGTHRFVYMHNMDAIIRTDFHAWAMANWHVLLDAPNKSI